jgi:hypothetical protein
VRHADAYTEHKALSSYARKSPSAIAKDVVDVRTKARDTSLKEGCKLVQNKLDIFSGLG